MWHLATFAGGPGRLPGGHSRGWLFMKNTIHINVYVDAAGDMQLEKPQAEERTREEGGKEKASRKGERRRRRW